MKRICLIFEFPPEADFQLRSVMETLKNKNPGDEVYCLHGFLKNYRPGGRSPSRVLNLLWMYCLLPIHLLLKRPSWILVRSAPPGIQVWCSLWAHLFKIPTIAWIMDYHPEIEIRALEQRALFRPGAKILRQIDRIALNQLHGAIVLDDAMLNTVKQQAPNLDIQVHPTWDQYAEQENVPQNGSQGPNNNKLLFVYAGNLSSHHPLETFERLLQSLSKQSPETEIELHVIGTSNKGEERFRLLAQRGPIQLHITPRIPFHALKQRLVELNPHYGIVLMDEKTAGLFSPSKFAGYLSAGIPLLYCGPPKTNADKICQDFHAGISLPARTPETTMENLALEMTQAETIQGYQKGVIQAYQYFTGYNARTFANQLSSMIHSTPHEAAL